MHPYPIWRHRTCFFFSLPYNYKLQQADNNYIGQMQNMAMKPVLKSNLNIQMAPKKSAKYGNERRSKEQFKHSDGPK